jgi:hypothetical protein
MLSGAKPKAAQKDALAPTTRELASSSSTGAREAWISASERLSAAANSGDEVLDMMGAFGRRRAYEGVSPFGWGTRAAFPAINRSR